MSKDKSWLGGVFLAVAFAMLPAAGQSVPSTNLTLIDTGCTGGFTGGGDGATITADDRLVRWSKITAAEPRVEIDLGPVQELAADLRDELDTIGFEDIDYEMPGNIACFVSYLGHTVVWSPGDLAVATDVAEIHQRLMAAVR